MTASQPPTTAPPADRSRWVALVVLCVGVLMIVLDATVVNVALPSIQSDLGFSQADLAWVVNAYLIAFACSRGSGNIVTIMPSTTAEVIAPPTP